MVKYRSYAKMEHSTDLKKHDVYLYKMLEHQICYNTLMTAFVMEIGCKCLYEKKLASNSPFDREKQEQSNPTILIVKGVTPLINT